MRCSRRFAMAMILALVVLFRAGPLWGVEAPTDSGAEALGHEAATYHIVNIYEYPGFKLIQFHLPVLAQYSYLLESGDQALVVDPGRDVSVYLDQAKKDGARIMGVFLTHNHADFVAGHMELARKANCPIFASAESHCTFRYQPLKEGSTIEVGEAIVKILVTPGHTPEALCGLVATQANPKEPILLLSGDTLWIGRLGRPDLIEGNTSAAALASLAYDTWTNKLRLLPGTMAIFPAHGGGTLYGLRLSDEPTSTLGTEKKTNSNLKNQSRGEFVAALLANRPEVPQYFGNVAALNKRGPQPVAWEKPPVPAAINWALTNSKQYYVVDLRSPQDYAAGHIPHAINIGVAGDLETWVGTLVPWDASLVLYGDPTELKEAATRLERIGYPARVITPEAWEKSRIPLAKSELLSPEDLKIRLAGEDSPVVVDVRPRADCAAQRLGKALSLPLEQLSALAPGQLDPAQPVVTVCDSTYCDSLAVGILERLGFKQVGCLAGGAEAWTGAGLQVSGAGPVAPKQVAAPAPRRLPKRVVRLPQRISAADLKRTILDLPGTYELIDIRPPEAFAAFSLPGSTNVDVAEILQNPLYLKGSGPLILVDRDGSLAMAVGGALSQKTWRPIKVLQGGLEAYKKETEVKPKAKQGPAPVKPESANAPAAEAKAAKVKAPWWKRLFQ
jgi:hydroxyacylglutathione hydrolase